MDAPLPVPLPPVLEIEAAELLATFLLFTFLLVLILLYVYKARLLEAVTE